ncbi:MAG: hypothetical protein AAGE94_11190, partial [Acidobacteriota bacterium]
MHAKLSVVVPALTVLLLASPFLTTSCFSTPFLTISLAAAPDPASGMRATEPWPADGADPAVERLLRQPYPASDGSSRDAFVYVPRGYATEPDRRWPVLLFLHGNGERGDGRDDLDWLLAEGPLY